MKIIIKIYIDKISDILNKKKSAVEEAPCEQLPCEEPAKPVWDEQPAYDE
jgi:hypothetical protein